VFVVSSEFIDSITGERGVSITGFVVLQVLRTNFDVCSENEMKPVGTQFAV
jgi:hypothetical protein